MLELNVATATIKNNCWAYEHMPEDLLKFVGRPTSKKSQPWEIIRLRDALQCASGG